MRDVPRRFRCSPVPVHNVVKQQQLYFYEHGFSTNVVINAIVTNKLIETELKNGQSGRLSADRLQFRGFHCCCCCSFTGVLQFATQDVPKKK